MAADVALPDSPAIPGAVAGNGFQLAPKTWGIQFAAVSRLDGYDMPAAAVAAAAAAAALRRPALGAARTPRQVGEGGRTR